MARVLVQGASRGLGLQFCRHIIKNKPESLVVATCRKPETATELQDFQKQNGDRVIIHKLDITKPDDIESVSDEVTKQFGRLDLLLNVSGMLHPSGRGETSLRDVSHQGLMDTFSTNTVGPLLMAKHFGPLLQKGSGCIGIQGNDSKLTFSAVLVNLSAKVGSITDNGLGGWYSYRMSKAALNMATKNLSIELGRGKRRIVCMALHPGTVDTALSRPYHKGVPKDKLFTTEYSVEHLMNIIDHANMSKTGKFFLWDGSEFVF